MRLPSIGLKLKYFIIVLSIAAILLGGWFQFFHSRGFVKTTGKIVSIEEEVTGTDESDYTVIVSYDVDGIRHVGIIDSYSPSYEAGKEIKIAYDPNDPDVVHSDDKFGLYFMGVGVVLLAGTLLTGSKKKRDEEILKETYGETVYADSEKGDERKLYFITDRGTPKYGHRIEDADCRVLYEAKVTKFNLLAPIAFDFIDHEHGFTTHHLIGHEEETEWETLLIDNNYTFTIDGQDIWKHLKENGIKVDTGFARSTAIHRNYRIFRDGEEIAFAENTGIYPHEGDAEKHSKAAGLIPVNGYYRITTREKYLDLIFITLMAFARSGALADNGGIYGGLRIEDGERNKKVWDDHSRDDAR